MFWRSVQAGRGQRSGKVAFYVRKGFSRVTSPLLHDSAKLPQGTSRNWTHAGHGMGPLLPPI